MKDQVQWLRIVAILEGISLLVLLFIAMPLKYHYCMPEAVSLAGRTHGALFLVFSGMLVVVSQRQAWPERFSFMVFMASMIPFASFVMDRRIKALIAPGR
jgi:integral membrane protein